MKAIVRQGYGGPDTLQIQEVPAPQPQPGQVLVRVRAFGLNRAEQYFRQGLWGEVAAISGIECVGEVVEAPGGEFEPGQTVFALMGGMGRSIAGSYAEFVCVPASSVVAVRSELPWTALAALPESYATAWSSLHDNLEMQPGQTLLIRGATSALGQAALAIAVAARVRVVATVSRPERMAFARELGAQEVAVETDALHESAEAPWARGVDAVLDLLGTRTMLDSLRLVRRRGRVCVAGFLGGGGPIEAFDPIAHLPSGRHLSFFGSAFVYGTPEYPLSDVPFQHIVDQAEAGVYRAQPARVFAFDDIQAAHRVLDAHGAGGKMVVTLG